MKKIIKELRQKAKNHLSKIGMTPYSDFKGTQKDHDDIHRKLAADYKLAAAILSKHIIK